MLLLFFNATTRRWLFRRFGGYKVSYITINCPYCYNKLSYITKFLICFYLFDFIFNKIVIFKEWFFDLKKNLMSFWIFQIKRSLLQYRAILKSKKHACLLQINLRQFQIRANVTCNISDFYLFCVLRVNPKQL